MQKVQQHSHNTKKYYVAEPSEYPMRQKFDFSTTPKEKKTTKDMKKLFILSMLNQFGNGWKNLKIAKPQRIALV